MRRVCLSLVLLVVSAYANTPGKHTVLLSWTASPTPGVTYNIYRGPAAGVCNGTPTPYATGITATNFVDSSPLSGTQFYNVSAVGSSGESACDGEVSVSVPNVTTGSPSGLGGSVN
jgi:hypothetical protein